MFLLMFFVACTETEDDATSASTSAEADVETLARAATLTSEAIGDISTEMTLVSGSFAGVGDCVWSYEVSGTPLSGTIEMALESTPCGGTYTGNSGSGSYTVTEGALSGTYQGSAGDWELSLSGARSATLEITTERRGTRSWDSSWTVDELYAATDGESLGAWGVDLTYDGFAGRSWNLSVDGGDGTITGTLAGENRSCTVTGTTSSLDIACDE